MTSRVAILAHVAVALVVTGALAAAQAAPPRGTPSSALPEELRDVSFRPPLGERLPLDVRLVDSRGTSVVLGDVVGARPALVVPVYFECPMLCQLVLDGLLRGLRGLSLAPGDDFDVVVYSFDPDEGTDLAASNRRAFLAGLGLPPETPGVRFLTGDAPQLARLDDALGFHARLDEAGGEWAHGAGLVAISPDGTLSRALLGAEFAPRDLRLAVLEAGRGEVASLTDAVLLYCFRYDPERGTYGAAVMNIVRAGGVATLVALVGFLVLSLRRERRAARIAAEEG